MHRKKWTDCKRVKRETTREKKVKGSRKNKSYINQSMLTVVCSQNIIGYRYIYA